MRPVKERRLMKRRWQVLSSSYFSVIKTGLTVMTEKDRKEERQDRHHLSCDQEMMTGP